MFARTLITSCLLLLIGVPVQAAAVARAVPDATTGRLAPRSFESGGSTCYYRCPDTFTASDGQEAVNPTTPGNGVCDYNNGNGVNYQCTYNGSGDLVTGNTGCPARATDAGCIPTGNTPAADTFRRRGSKVLTRAQKIIKARQFRPKKVTKRRA